MGAMTPVHPRRLWRAAWALVTGLALAGCGVSGPQPAIYVLGGPAAPTAVVTPEMGLPIVLVRQVELPDYLDTTDLQERRGDEIVQSRAGRWGERLSVGFTRALTAALGARLPGMAVVASPPIERPAQQILVDIEAFEPRPEGFVLLLGRFRVTDGTARDVMISERTSLVEPVTGTGEAARVAAMTRAIDGLAARIAAKIGGIPGRLSSNSPQTGPVAESFE